jgi:hypothetical protein
MSYACRKMRRKTHFSTLKATGEVKQACDVRLTATTKKGSLALAMRVLIDCDHIPPHGLAQLHPLSRYRCNIKLCFPIKSKTFGCSEWTQITAYCLASHGVSSVIHIFPNVSRHSVCAEPSHCNPNPYNETYQNYQVQRNPSQVCTRRKTVDQFFQ